VQASGEWRVRAKPQQGEDGLIARIKFSDLSDKHRSVVRFILLQFFLMIYIQRFAVGSGVTQISVPMVLALLSVVYMQVTRKLSMSTVRVSLYCLFVASMLSSMLLTRQLLGSYGSLLSFLQVIVAYWPITIATDLPEEVMHSYVFDKFVKFMILPAAIVIFQYCWQKGTGMPDFLNLDQWLPKSVLAQGFSYHMPYPWNSPFTRPNGLFFLEPSVISMFTAAAAVVEMMYYRRVWFLVLFSFGTAMSMGGTGFTILLIATPMVLIKRLPLSISLPLIAVAVITVNVLAGMGVPLPLLSRMDELDHASSGNARLTQPFNSLMTLLNDPGYVFTGEGAGTTSLSFGTSMDMGSPWPIVKLLYEYGSITTLAYIAMFAGIVLSNRDNIPLKVAFIVIFHFTGGYLVDSFAINFFSILAMYQTKPKPAVSPAEWNYTEPRQVARS
jgi:hypothetical protein